MTRPSAAMRALGVWMTACLVGCAPMPKLSANWYTVVDPEPDPARQAETRQDGSTEIPTREVTRLLLAILNQERTIVTLKDIVINPIVDDQGNTVDGLGLTGPDPIAIEPGQMLLLEIHRNPPRGTSTALKPAAPPSSDLRTWKCAIPTRVQMTTAFVKRWDWAHYRVDEHRSTLELSNPMPSALPYDWQHCWNPERAMRSSPPARP